MYTFKQDWSVAKSFDSSTTARSKRHSTSTGDMPSTSSSRNGFKDSATLSRQPLFHKKYEALTSGRRSPVFKDPSYREKRKSMSEDPTNGSTLTSSSSTRHPVNRSLSQRATSVEKLFPLRPMRKSLSKDDINGNKSFNSTTTSATESSQNITGSTGDLSRLSEPPSVHDKYNSMSRLESSHHYSDYSNNSGRSTSPFQNGDSLYTTEDMSHLKLEHQKQIQELKLEYQSKLLAKDREWDKKLQTSRTELSATQENVNKLNQKCRQMSGEYEKSINQLLTNKERRKSTTDLTAVADVVADLTNYRPPGKCQGCEDLKQTEKDFTELHKRFDKLRGTCNILKKNEEKLKEQLAKKHKELQDSVQKFEKVKAESQDKLKKAATEVEKAKAACKGEIIRLQMALKKSEVHSQGLQQQLDMKMKENTELTSICDNLIAIKSTV